MAICPSRSRLRAAGHVGVIPSELRRGDQSGTLIQPTNRRVDAPSTLRSLRSETQASPVLNLCIRADFATSARRVPEGCTAAGVVCGGLTPAALAILAARRLGRTDGWRGAVSRAAQPVLGGRRGGR